MMIPKLHYISQGNSTIAHLENIQKACASGAELVQLRLKNTAEKKWMATAVAAREITAQFQTRLIINDNYKIAKAVKADGVHLGITDACPQMVRKHLYSWQYIGGSANTLQACQTLLEKEVDYISLGPFRLSTTKADLPQVLGLSGYTAILDALKTDTPILGVGGITPTDVPDILATGISGIAVSGAITHDFNTIRIFHQLLNASSTEEKRHTF